MAMSSAAAGELGTTHLRQQAVRFQIPGLSRKHYAQRPQVRRRQRVSTQAGASLLGSQQIATVLGYAVLAGAAVRSVPQILRMYRNKSAQGVSLTSNVSEMTAYTINVAYNLQLGYPFISYGEVMACWLQDVVIVALIFRYNAIRGWKPWVGTVGFGVCCWTVMSGACSRQLLYGLQASTVAIISLGGRVPQIWMNYRRGDSGELSMATVALNLFGNSARVVTTLILTKDNLIMAASVLGVILNAVLLVQTLQTAQRNEQAEPGYLKPQIS